MVDGNSNPYTACKDKRSGNSKIYFARSTDRGATWSATATLVSVAYYDKQANV